MTAMAGSSLLSNGARSAAFASCRRVAWTLACARRHASSCQTSAVRRWPSKNDRSGRRHVPNTRQTMQALAAGCMAAAMLSSAAMAEDPSRIALVPGGPHPYFAAWEQAGQDAARDFKLGAADYRVPAKWELSQQNQLLESLLSQGYNAFLVFPGDPVGSNSTVSELVGEGAPVIALAGCFKQPTDASFCLG